MGWGNTVVKRFNIFLCYQFLQETFILFKNLLNIPVKYSTLMVEMSQSASPFLTATLKSCWDFIMLPPEKCTHLVGLFNVGNQASDNVNMVIFLQASTQQHPAR